MEQGHLGEVSLDFLLMFSWNSVKVLVRRLDKLYAGLNKSCSG